MAGVLGSSRRGQLQFGAQAEDRVWIQGITKGPHNDRETCFSVCVCCYQIAGCISVCQDHIKHSELFRERKVKR